MSDENTPVIVETVEEVAVEETAITIPDLSYLEDFLKDAITAEAPSEVFVPLNEDGEFINVYSFEEGQAVGNLKFKVLEDAESSIESTDAPTTKFETTVTYSFTDNDGQPQTLLHSTGEEVEFTFVPATTDGLYGDVYLCIKAMDGEGNNSKTLKIKVS